DCMSLHLICLLACLPAAAEDHASSGRYPRSDLLIEAAELTEPAAGKKFRIIDVRPLDRYKAGHLPLASTINTTRWSKDFAADPDQKLWQDRLANVGINIDTRVVVYGDDLRDTARIWYIIRYWGVKEVRILNGGWRAWQAAHGKV